MYFSLIAIVFSHLKHYGQTPTKRHDISYIFKTDEKKLSTQVPKQNPCYGFESCFLGNLKNAAYDGKTFPKIHALWLGVH